MSIEHITERETALQAELDRVTTLAHGQHVELYNARLELAAIKGQEPVAYMSPTGENIVHASRVGDSVPNWTDYYTVPLYLAVGAQERNVLEPMEYQLEAECKKCGAKEIGVLKFTTPPVQAQKQRKPLSTEEIEALAVKHEAFGFGLVDTKGYTTHGFDPDGLHAFVKDLAAHGITGDPS